MNSIISPELNYQKSVLSHGSYRFSRVLPQNGSMSPILSTSNTTVSFDLPAQTLNFAKSRLVFSLLTTPTAAVAQINASPLAVFSRVYVSTRGGLTLMDLNDVGYYDKMTNQISTPSEVFQDRGGGLASYAQNGTAAVGYLNANTSMADPISGIQQCRTLASGNTLTNGAASVLAFNEPRYLITGNTPQGQPAAPQPLSVSYSIPMSTFKHTILNCQKDLFFGQIITLNFVLAAHTQFCWESNAAAPVAGAVAFAIAPVISNMSFMLALETNPQVIEVLTSKINSSEGFQLNIPFPVLQKISIANAGIVSTTFRLNRGMGHNLLRVFYSCFQPGTTLNTAMNNTNLGGLITTSFYQTTDGFRDTEFNCLPSDATDWLVNKDLFEGSSMRNHLIWNQAYTWMTDFSGQPPSTCDDHATAGLSLENERSIASFATVSQAVNLYQYCICQRTLVIQGGQVLCV